MYVGVYMSFNWASFMFVIVSITISASYLIRCKQILIHNIRKMPEYPISSFANRFKGECAMFL